uniref:Uncharacterized protein n=1 Tax=Heterorhabditis bacteriophora TaxID=37862 RepID=A0A1I7WXJ7_HETBA
MYIKMLFLQGNTQFGMVRDRLFHAMLVKVALSYSNNVSRFWRRVIEFLSLLTVSFDEIGKKNIYIYIIFKA